MAQPFCGVGPLVFVNTIEDDVLIFGVLNQAGQTSQLREVIGKLKTYSVIVHRDNLHPRILVGSYLEES